MIIDKTCMILAVKITKLLLAANVNLKYLFYGATHHKGRFTSFLEEFTPANLATC